MIKDIIGNLLETTECNVICHQANLFLVMSAGIALAIKNKFPEAYAVDLKTKKGDTSKLGTYSVAKILDSKGTSIQHIVNLYSQMGLGGQDRQTSYDAMVNGLTMLRENLDARIKEGKQITLGLPFQLGCGLANGDFRIVRAIIEVVFFDALFDVYIYKLPELV